MTRGAVKSNWRSGNHQIASAQHFHSLPACLSACLPVCMPACLPVCVPACLPICLPACLPACMSACLPVCLPACQSVCLPSCPSSCLPFCLPAFFFCLPVCLSVFSCLSLYFYLSSCLPLYFYLSSCMPFCLWLICPSVWLPSCLSSCLSSCLPFYLSSCLPFSFSFCLPACISVPLPVCLPTRHPRYDRQYVTPKGDPDGRSIPGCVGRELGIKNTHTTVLHSFFVLITTLENTTVQAATLTPAVCVSDVINKAGMCDKRCQIRQLNSVQ